MWWNHLKKLIAVDDNSGNFEGFNTIAGLKTGEGVVFCPLALGTSISEEGERIGRFGRECLVVKVRRKLTATTGQSIFSQSV
jgi:hypothetical protein